MGPLPPSFGQGTPASMVAICISPAGTIAPGTAGTAGAGVAPVGSGPHCGQGEEGTRTSAPGSRM